MRWGRASETPEAHKEVIGGCRVERWRWEVEEEGKESEGVIIIQKRIFSLLSY